MNYTTDQFVEIIETEGAKFIRSQTADGFHARLYENPEGIIIIIDTTEQDLEDEVMKGYLIKLGFANLIPALFPIILVSKHDELKSKKEQNN